VDFQCVKCEEIKRSGYFPYAMLLIPPYEVDESEYDAHMETILEMGTYQGGESSNMTGLTAGLAIESTAEIPFVAKVTVGASIDHEWSQTLSEGTVTTYAERFNAETTSTMGPLTGEPTVVLTQTKYEVAEYDVISDGSYSGSKFWIAHAVHDGDNPELTKCYLSDYEELKDPDAVFLEGVHQIGSADSYSKSEHGCDHIRDPDWCTNFNLAKEKEKNIRGANWASTIEEYRGTELAQETRENFYARGEIANTSVQASFGAIQGSSHKTWSGAYTVYDWNVGPTLGPDFEYSLWSVAEYVVYKHKPGGTGEMRKDALLLLDYYMHNESYAWPWENSENQAEAYLYGEAWKIIWPDNPGPGIPENWTLVIDTQLCGSPADYYAYLVVVADDLESWAAGFPPEDVSDFNATVDELQDFLADILALDPDNSAYYPAVKLMLGVIVDQGNLAFMPIPSDIGPEPVRNGDMAMVTYEPSSGPLPEGVPVDLMLSQDGGASHSPLAMTQDSSSDFWWAEFPVSASVDQLDYYFEGDGVLDDLGGAHWRMPVTDTTRDHDNGSVVLTLTEHGTLGFLDQTKATGQGFIVAGENRLRIGGLWVGNETYVASRDYDGDAAEWVPDGETGGGVWRKQPTALQLTHAVFEDAGALEPWGLRVHQGGLSWPATDDPANDEGDFVILSYLIANEGDLPLAGLYIGQYVDFDVQPGSPTSDGGGTDPDRRLAYMHGDPGQPYVGVCLLDEPAGPLVAHASLVDYDTHIAPLGYLLDSEKYAFMSGASSAPGPLGPADLGTLVSIGPFSLAPGQRQVVNFALVAGSDLAKLQANVDWAASWLPPAPGGLVMDVESENPLPANPKLAQNYPNPFNPSTCIRFLAPARDRMTLDVVSLRGERVRRLLDGVVGPGVHTVNWDGVDSHGERVASGTYFCQLRGFGRTETRKMALVR